MKILAFDTCNNICSVGLYCNDQIYSHNSEASNTQSALLIPYIQDLLSRSNSDLSQLDYIIVTNGPGSFTGVRVGLSVAIGLKIYRNLKILTVNSLAFTYLSYLSLDFYKGKVLVINEAPKDEVYYQYFENLQPVSNEPLLGKIELLSEQVKDIVIIGNSQNKLSVSLKDYISVNQADLGTFIKFSLQNNLMKNNSLFSHNLSPFYLRDISVN